MGLRKYNILHLLTYWLFWYIIPTVEFRVKWPAGKLTVEYGHPSWDWAMSASLQEIYSADPNDHFRPWLEKHVGKQGWDWDWEIMNRDVAENTLTIRIRRDKAKYATLAAIQWQ